MGRERSKLIRELRQFKDKIGKNYRIEKVILFGSRLTGKIDENSDVDLIIVGEEFRDKGVLKRSPPLYLEWDLEYPADFLCYTPEEFEARKKRIGIVKEAVEKGIEI
jgi:Nucleotidyltransferase domain.